MEIGQIDGNVDVLVLTMKTEERQYVRRALGPLVQVRVPPTYPSIQVGALPSVNKGEPPIVAHSQILGQGPAAAQEVTTTLASLLKPKWIFIVGIAGMTVREPTVTLGDALIASRVYGPLNRAESPDGADRSSEVGGAAMGAEVESLASQIRDRINDAPAHLRPLEFDWTPTRPSVNVRNLEFGSPSLSAWNQEIRSNVERHFGRSPIRTSPRCWLHPFFSDGILRKDPAALEKETASRRDVVGVEMEVGGALIGARRFPGIRVTTIRGVSDIVGLKRDEQWTNYAAAIAAGALKVTLESGLIDAGQKPSELIEALERATKADPSVDTALEGAELPVLPTLTASDSGERSASGGEGVQVDSPEARELIESEIQCGASANPPSVDEVSKLARSVNLYWLDRFSTKLLVNYLSKGRGKPPLLSSIIAEHLATTRPAGDPTAIRAQAEECALSARWGVATKKPFSAHIQAYACEHQLTQDFFAAQSIAWRYSTYSSGTKQTASHLADMRRHLDRVYTFRVNQLLKEIIAHRSKTDQQYESRIARTVERLLETSEGAAISPVDRTHIYYVAGRLMDDRLRRKMKKVLSEEASRVEKSTGADKRGSGPTQFMMMWRSLYVSLGYLGDTPHLCDYIKRLLEEPEQDEHNRGFHLEYYGDQPLQVTGPDASVDLLGPFPRTMGTLLSRLQLESNSTLLEAQTLASLAQKRHEMGLLRKHDRVLIAECLQRVAQRKLPTWAAEDLNQYFLMVAEHLLTDAFRPELFLHSLNRTRHEQRTGWVDRTSPQIESVASHSFSTIALAMDFLPERYTPSNGDLYSKLAVVAMLFHHDRPEGITGDIPSPRKTAEDDEREEEIMRTYGLFETYALGRRKRGIGRIGFAAARDHFVEFMRQKSFNARVAKDIDRVDAIYEAVRLIAENPDDVHAEPYDTLIAGQRNKIKTELGLYVLERVAGMHPRFAEIVEAALRRVSTRLDGTADLGPSSRSGGNH